MAVFIVDTTYLTYRLCHIIAYIIFYTHIRAHNNFFSLIARRMGSSAVRVADTAYFLELAHVARQSFCNRTKSCTHIFIFLCVCASVSCSHNEKWQQVDSNWIIRCMHALLCIKWLVTKANKLITVFGIFFYCFACFWIFCKSQKWRKMYQKIKLYLNIFYIYFFH